MCRPAATVLGTVVFNLAAICHLVKKKAPADPADQAEQFYSKEVCSLYIRISLYFVHAHAYILYILYIILQQGGVQPVGDDQSQLKLVDVGVFTRNESGNCRAAQAAGTDRTRSPACTSMAPIALNVA